MPKPVDANFIKILQTKTGTEPIFLLSINFGAGNNWFASKAVYGYDPSIISIGACSCERRADSEGTTGTVSVTLSDYNGFAKFMYDTVQLEKAAARLLVAFEDKPAESAFCVLAGQVVGPVDWNEENRTLSFSLETLIDSEELGFAAIDEFPDLAPEAKNVAWPMMFGAPTHVPALRVRKQVEGRTMTPIRLNSNLYKFNQGEKIAVMDEDCHVLSYFNGDQTKDVINVENGDKFPQGQAIEIEIDRVVFKGSFSGTTFTVMQANAPYYTDIDLIGGPKSDKKILEVLETYIDPTKFTGNLTGMHLYFEGPPKTRLYNQCEKQEKDRLKLKYSNFDLTNGNQPIVAQRMTKGKILRAYAVLPNGIDNRYAANHEVILGVEQNNILPWNIQGGAQQMIAKIKLSGMMELMGDMVDNPGRVMWTRPAGTVVKVHGQDPEIYIASAVPLTSVDAVVGKKSVVLPDGRTVKCFEPIPESYYTVQLQSNYKINDNDYATAILFNEPLKSREEEGWDDNIYITGTSSVGPNVVEIIKYIIKVYVPGLHIGDFDATDEPANFAFLEKRNALDVCREIAWQARCALRVDGPTADLVFLDVDSHPVTLTVDQDMVKAGSLKVSNTDVNQIKTKLLCKWRPDYRHLPMPVAQVTHRYEIAKLIAELTSDVDRKENIYVYRENIARYGERSESREVYIYNTESAVEKTAEYWGHIYANSWRTVSFDLFLIGAFVQAFDWIALDINGFEMSGYSGLRGEVQRMTLDPVKKTTSFLIRLSVIDD